MRISGAEFMHHSGNISVYRPSPVPRAPPRGDKTQVVCDHTGDLFVRWQQLGDRRARDELLAEFLPLARRLASRYSNSYEPQEDLVQVASIGLLVSIERFDSQRGIQFSAFAIPTILGELKRHFRNTGWSAHVPRGAQEMAAQVDQATRQLTTESGRAPSVSAIAAHLNVDVRNVLTGLEASSARHCTSLNAPIPGGQVDEPRSLADSLSVIDDRFGLIETKLSLLAGISRLPDFEREALSLRVRQDMKQTEIADRMGCSQMQVSRLLRRAAIILRQFSDPPFPQAETQAA
jgi:RNA polymerase sigma-B factor